MGLPLDKRTPGGRNKTQHVYSKTQNSKILRQARAKLSPDLACPAQPHNKKKRPFQVLFNTVFIRHFCYLRIFCDPSWGRYIEQKILSSPLISFAHFIRVNMWEDHSNRDQRARRILSGGNCQYIIYGPHVNYIGMP